MTTPNAVSVAATAVIAAESRTLSASRGRRSAPVASFPGSCWVAVSISAHLERRERRRGREHRNDPEPRHDLRLGPALELEVVVEGRALEDALPGQLERGDLEHDGARLAHEDEGDERQ